MTGMWDDPAVPKHGWNCVGVGDNGPHERYWQVCQMCDVQPIRYVHSMEHDAWPDTLLTGCVCAGRLEGSVGTARSREREFKTRAKQQWRTSKAGNVWLPYRECRLIIMPTAGGFRVVGYYEKGTTNAQARLPGPFATMEEAQGAAFQLVARLRPS